MRNRNSSKSQMFLMEFICVVMFFVLCVALCINVFVKADSISKEGCQLNEALLLAQSTAESLKVMENLNHDKIVMIENRINSNTQGKYIVKVEDEVIGDMLKADIYVYNMEYSETDICTISMKKYSPGEVQDAD